MNPPLRFFHRWYFFINMCAKRVYNFSIPFFKCSYIPPIPGVFSFLAVLLFVHYCFINLCFFSIICIWACVLFSSSNMRVYFYVRLYPTSLALIPFSSLYIFWDALYLLDVSFTQKASLTATFLSCFYEIEYIIV